MKVEYYIQCRLTKDTENGTAYITTWIPQYHAKVGNICELSINGIWQKNWIIKSMGAGRISKTTLMEERRKHKDFIHSIK